MLTTEIQQDTHTGPVTLNPRWLRIPSAVKYSGRSRSRLYELLAQGRINSTCVKSHNDALRGVRLVDRESIDLFMENLKSFQESELPRHDKCLRVQPACSWGLFNNFAKGYYFYFYTVVSTSANGPVAAPERPVPLLRFQRLSTPFNSFQRQRY